MCWDARLLLRERSLSEPIRASSPQPGSTWQSPHAGSSWRAFEKLLPAMPLCPTAQTQSPENSVGRPPPPDGQGEPPLKLSVRGPRHIPTPWSQPGPTAEAAGQVPTCTSQRVTESKALVPLMSPRPFPGAAGLH